MVAARLLGRTLAERTVQLVFGGSDVGLMGAVANGALDAGGDVLGVTTKALDAKGITHRGLTHLEVLEDMHARKRRMADVANAFIMLPGGFGTFDEFFEMVAWTQLGIQRKPCGVLDVCDYFAPLRTLLDSATTQRFIRPEHVALVHFAYTPDALLDALESWVPVVIEKWLDQP